MRGRQYPQVTLLAYIDLETRVPTDHPLRVIKMLADQALKALSPDLDRMYAMLGRPSIPPGRLLGTEWGRLCSARWCWKRSGRGLLSDEHFTVDGTLIEAAARRCRASVSFSENLC